jgi:ATP-grasp domain, R2K clade family 3
MRPVVLYRYGDMEASELEAARRHFTTFSPRTALQRDDFVIGRYSVLPFFKHGIQADCDYIGATLINNFHQHCYVADLRNWVEDLRELTPKTWYRLEDIDEPGPYVLKGKTNSRKFDWRSHMFAKDHAAANEVYWRLATDGLIGGEKQDIYIRKYIPLKQHLVGINGLPISHEFRAFCAFGKLITGAFYWSNYFDEIPSTPQFSDVPLEFIDEVLRRVGDQIPFVAIDFAQDAAGNWWVIELNDGQMSGLSMNDPEVLYGGLRRLVDQHLATLGK